MFSWKAIVMRMYESSVKWQVGTRSLSRSIHKHAQNEVYTNKCIYLCKNITPFGLGFYSCFYDSVLSWSVWTAFYVCST